eukprot:TRINITY_DN18384_c1_g1_i4.p1 TRINITY_DN18384_c1_g1~~TRINITY_DN18384_c1_g1_i4.p1  ORF type:complete len:249 (-),score=28.05 TRINITY_DN18384_c1_g1_i4:549-1295(-)
MWNASSASSADDAASPDKLEKKRLRVEGTSPNKSLFDSLLAVLSADAFTAEMQQILRATSHDDCQFCGQVSGQSGGCWCDQLLCRRCEKLAASCSCDDPVFRLVACQCCGYSASLVGPALRDLGNKSMDEVSGEFLDVGDELCPMCEEGVLEMQLSFLREDLYLCGACDSTADQEHIVHCDSSDCVAAGVLFHQACMENRSHPAYVPDGGWLCGGCCQAGRELFVESEHDSGSEHSQGGTSRSSRSSR